MAEPVRWPLALRQHLGDDGVAALLAAQKEWKEDVLTTATDRFERRLVEECAKLRIEIGTFRADLVAQITSTRAEILRWSFAFWVGQMAAIVGLFLSRG